MSVQAGQAVQAAVQDVDSPDQALPPPAISPLRGDLLNTKRIEQFLGVPLPTELSDIPVANCRFLDESELEQLLVERSPFFFLNRAVALDNRTVLAVARMTIERCAGHFPNQPIVPLIELCKAMAQAGIILVALSAGRSDAPIAIGSGNSKAIAKELIRAPVDILIHVSLESSRLKLHFVNGSAFVGQRKIGTLANIVYTLIPRAQLAG